MSVDTSLQWAKNDFIVKDAELAAALAAHKAEMVTLLARIDSLQADLTREKAENVETILQVDPAYPFSSFLFLLMP